jgi:hypothetical protein
MGIKIEFESRLNHGSTFSLNVHSADTSKILSK